MIGVSADGTDDELWLRVHDGVLSVHVSMYVVVMFTPARLHLLAMLFKEDETARRRLVTHVTS